MFSNKKDAPPERLEKCYIANTKSQSDSVSALFNPSEITIEKSVPWNKHQNPKGNSPMLEFTHGENRTLSAELFFDGSEPDDEDIYGEYIQKLENMTLAPKQPFGKFGHPPFVIFIWGAAFKFRGVLTSLSTKYSRFSSNGSPLRATCSIKIKEVEPGQGLGGPFAMLEEAMSWIPKIG